MSLRFDGRMPKWGWSAVLTLGVVAFASWRLYVFDVHQRHGGDEYLNTYEPCGFNNGGTWAAGVARGESPLDLHFDQTPAITCADISDRPAGFVADTFILPPPAGNRDLGWYMFFEVLSHTDFKGDLGLAYSLDEGRTWAYAGLVMDEPFHLSYPLALRHKGRLYMIPETGEANEIRLYTADESPGFLPVSWKRVKTLVQGPHKYRDNSVVQYNGQWYMWSLTEPHCRLYTAPDLLGPWTEHPASPLHIDPSYRRPGGRPVVYQGKVYRFAQVNYENVFNYGRESAVIRVDTLDDTHYGETVVKHITGDPQSQWISRRIHNIDPHEIAPGKWVMGVDGDSQLNVPFTRYVLIAAVILVIAVTVFVWQYVGLLMR